MAIERAFQTNIVILPSVPTSIVSVQGKRKDSQFFSSVPYELVERTVTLKRAYDQVKVEYTIEEKVPFNPQIAKEILNGNLSTFQQIGNIVELEAKALDSQIERLSVEGAPMGEVIGTVLGGFQSLTENIKENIGVTDEPVIAEMTSSVPSITVTKTSNKTSEITTLTGKPATNGFLNAVIVSGNPKGINQSLKNVIKAKDNQIKTALEQSSPIPEKATTSVEKDISTDVANTAQKIVQKSMQELGNPVQSDSKVGFGSLGTSFGNLLGAIAGKIRNVGTTNKVGVSVPSFPGEVIIPPEYSDPGNIIEENGNTNLTNVVAKGNSASKQITLSDIPFNAIVAGNEFLGALTPDNYVFEVVDTLEELEFDLKNSTRTITTAVIDWSSTWSNNYYEAKDIQRLQVQDSVLKFGPTYPVTSGVEGGIQWHYVIQKDGTIQRGRPISVASGKNTKWYNYSVYVGFVAGYTVPRKVPNQDLYLSSASITPDQWMSFNSFISAFYKVYPGGEIVGRRDIDPSTVAPGFDVEVYLRGKRNKTTIYDFASDRETAISPDEAVNKIPKKISKPSTVGVPKTLSTKTVLSNSQKGVDASTGKIKVPTEQELALKANEITDLIKNADILSREQKIFQTDLIKNQTLGDASRLTGTLQNNSLLTNLDSVIKNVDELRSDLINNGYTYDEKTKSWSK